ncbi:MAG: FAD-dependent oxidoreductase [Verrucomicrobiaceae bacterium]|nr:FAD-dependent oxidoreductase [Verrucomicrobiaceae bacterium]
MNSNRRHFLKLGSLAATAWGFPKAISAATTPPHVLVIGGGFGGATVAKYLKMWGGNIDVTLVDRAASHYACILSNLVVTGALSMDRIKLKYDSLRSKRGVNVVQGEALAVDPSAKEVTVKVNGTSYAYSYDKLVLAPGIEFIAPPGNYNDQLTPHAWKAGPQTLLLKNQLSSMTKGQTFVMTIPKAPYRCPPGPYERACSVADYLLRKKSGARIVVLDANASIQAEPVNFGNAFNGVYKDVLTYVPNASITEVDSQARSITTSAGKFAGAVLNIIPNQRAGQIITTAGLANDLTGRWSTVDPLSYASTAQPDIHILGDSQATGQPKSGHMANSQAKVCADAIIRAFNGEQPDPNPVTSSACYSPITSKTAAWLTASFQYDPATKTMKRVDASFAEAPKPSGDALEEMYKWANNIFADSFA